MNKQKSLSHILCLALLLPLLALSPAHGADSTSFDPTKVDVKAKGTGGIPVGTVIAWPVASNPNDMDKWLECNGQSVSSAVYPELFAVVGVNVPDYRGLFLRGVGGNSAGLGVLQNDEFRSHTHPSNIPLGGGGGGQSLIYYGGQSATWNDIGAAGGAETRPVNKAVRYFIRAKP